MSSRPSPGAAMSLISSMLRLLWIFLFKSSHGVGSDDLELVSDAVTCDSNTAMKWLRMTSRESAARSFTRSQFLGPWSQELWMNWLHFGPASNPITPGLLGTVGRILGRESAAADEAASQLPEGYCLPGHITAGFFAAINTPWTYADGVVGRPDDPNVTLPRYVVAESLQLLTQSFYFVGLNHFADLGKLAGWPVGAAEILEAQHVLRRACPEDDDVGDFTVCTTGQLEAEFAKSFSNSFEEPLLPGHPASTAVPLNRRDSYAIPAPVASSCRARAAAGGSPCQVQVWYLGTHEALFKEVEHMWNLVAPEEFFFEFARINEQGIYNPASHDVKGKSKGSRHLWESSLEWVHWKVTTESDLDIMPSIIRAEDLMSLAGVSNGYDVKLCLCTIPAEVCAAFSRVSEPVVMYAANPATAQVPFSHHKSTLSLLAIMASDPKNHLLVSNAFAQAQFEYQLGVHLPMIRVHGLYTGISRKDGALKRGTEVLVYDRASPLLARVLEALRQHPPQGAAESSSSSATRPDALPSRFLHIADTDREYSTFAEFGAVVFMPGDVEQMAFYEFYSMALPIFVPAEPGRYMWPQLLVGNAEQDKSCGEFSQWVGTWQVTFKEDYFRLRFRVDCQGEVASLTDDNSVLARGQLHSLRALDALAFTHCLRLDVTRRGKNVTNLQLRMRLLPDYIDIARTWGSGSSCVGDFWENSNDVTGAGGGYMSLVKAEREQGSVQPHWPIIWDHDIFASVAWYLDSRLPGPRRTKHSPFELGSLAAAREWAGYMDYFRFPGIGLFVSFAQLQALLASDGEAGLTVRSRAMRAFNKVELEYSMQKWKTVLSAAVNDATN